MHVYLLYDSKPGSPLCVVLEREDHPLPRATWGVELEGSTAAVCQFIRQGWREGSGEEGEWGSGEGMKGRRGVKYTTHTMLPNFYCRHWYTQTITNSSNRNHPLIVLLLYSPAMGLLYTLPSRDTFSYTVAPYKGKKLCEC